MAGENHKDCKHYDRIDTDYGKCILNPPTIILRPKQCVGTECALCDYPLIDKNGKACSQFVAKE